MEALAQIKSILEVIATSYNTTGFEEPAINSAIDNCLQLETALLQVQLLVVSNMERVLDSELDAAMTFLLKKLSHDYPQDSKKQDISIPCVRKRQNILDLSRDIKTQAVATGILAVGIRLKFEPRSTVPATPPLKLTPRLANPSDQAFTLINTAQSETLGIQIVREKSMFSMKETIKISSQACFRSRLAESIASGLTRN